MITEEWLRVPVKMHGVIVGSAKIDRKGHMDVVFTCGSSFGKEIEEKIREGVLKDFSFSFVPTTPMQE